MIHLFPRLPIWLLKLSATVSRSARTSPSCDSSARGLAWTSLPPVERPLCYGSDSTCSTYAKSTHRTTKSISQVELFYVSYYYYYPQTSSSILTIPDWSRQFYSSTLLPHPSSAFRTYWTFTQSGNSLYVTSRELQITFITLGQNSNREWPKNEQTIYRHRRSSMTSITDVHTVNRTNTISKVLHMDLVL